MRVKSQKAFTLIETLVAMIILAGALVVLGNSWSGSLGAIRKSRNVTAAALLLQRKVTELELKYQDKFSEVPEDDGGDFGSDYPEYTWKLKTKKLEVPDLTAGLTAREGGASDMELTIVRQLTDLIEASVKEMKISITWKKGTKAQDYSITTYLIDWNKDL